MQKLFNRCVNLRLTSALSFSYGENKLRKRNVTEKIVENNQCELSVLPFEVNYKKIVFNSHVVEFFEIIVAITTVFYFSDRIFR